MLHFIIHNGLHLLLPVLIAYHFWKSLWRKTSIIMISVMLVDIDHLLANPVFDPNRCSIGFHPLHSLPAIGLYLLLSFFPKTRIISIGLLLHMFVDWTDCLYLIKG